MDHDSGVPTERGKRAALSPAGSGGDGSGLSPRFKLIFATVVGLTVLALVLNVVLALCGDGSEQVRAVADTCSTTYKLGFGAIVGLLGAKAM